MMMTPEQFAALVDLMAAVSEQRIPGNVADDIRHKASRERAERAAYTLLVEPESTQEVKT